MMKRDTEENCHAASLVEYYVLERRTVHRQRLWLNEARRKKPSSLQALGTNFRHRIYHS